MSQKDAPCWFLICLRCYVLPLLWVYVLPLRQFIFCRHNPQPSWLVYRTLAISGPQSVTHHLVGWNYRWFDLVFWVCFFPQLTHSCQPICHIYFRVILILYIKIPKKDTTTNQRSHSDLIRICSTFHEILSEDVAYSCNYSMLYYKGQRELYSDLLMQNETEAVLKARNDLSFCSDSRLEDTSRSMTWLMPPGLLRWFQMKEFQWLREWSRSYCG